MTDLQDTARLLKEMAASIDGVFNDPNKPKEVGFVLLIMPFGAPEGARTNYVSNGKREDILVMLKEVVARFEGQAHQSGRA